MNKKAKKQLLKIVDILGIAALPKQKGILFYIYTDLPLHLMI